MKLSHLVRKIPLQILKRMKNPTWIHKNKICQIVVKANKNIQFQRDIVTD